jgi:hypothetical protein
MSQVNSSLEKIPGRKKRRRPLDTTRLTRDYYREKGWCITYVQRTIKQRIKGQPFPRTISFDAFGFADHFAFPYPWRMRPEQGTLKAIQTCAVNDISGHLRKILACARAMAFLEVTPGHSIVIAAWARGKNRGDPMRRRFRIVKLSEFEKAIREMPIGASSVLKLRARKPKKEKSAPLFDGVTS